jgi:aspartyl-tRNA(Asn)/glutamyl-tRNA(Gln) amidotransferase subunit B
MNEGSLRCDANVSLRKRGSEKLGTRAEVKNMNSFRSVERAIDHEIERQARLLNAGGTVVQETRLWDADRGETRSMRSKEEAHDYRYFPEPDLLPLEVSPAWIEEVRRTMPELPEARRARFEREFGLSTYDAGVLTASKELADYFESAVREQPSPKAVANWVMGDIMRIVNERTVDAEPDFTDIPVAPNRLASLVGLIERGTISGKIAKTVFQKLCERDEDPAAIVAREGLVQVTDEGAIASVVERVLAANAGKVAEYRAGKEKLLGFFVGQVMKESAGKASPEVVNRLLKEKLVGG